MRKSQISASMMCSNLVDLQATIDVFEKEKVEYSELDINNIIQSNQKLVAFVGTSKNGTSFLVNNVAEILSMNGIDTAILDLTKNRNAYYIYTKNEETLRTQSNYIMNNLKIGRANGIQEHANLTIYTSPLENDENLEAVEPIIQTLLSLTDGSGLKITTEEYYTPKGSTIHKVGITPDEEVKLPDTVKSIYSVTKDEDTQLKKAIETLKNE